MERELSSAQQSPPEDIISLAGTELHHLQHKSPYNHKVFNLLRDLWWDNRDVVGNRVKASDRSSCNGKTVLTALLTCIDLILEGNWHAASQRARILSEQFGFTGADRLFTLISEIRNGEASTNELDLVNRARRR